MQGMEPGELTPPQAKVLDIFRRRAAAGEPPPTYAEIARECGWSSRNAAKQHVLALKRKGALKAVAPGLARGTSTGEQIVYRTKLIDSLDDPRGAIDLPIPPFLLPEQGLLFAFHQTDDRLASAGVLADDLILVGTKATPVKPKHIVVSEKGTPVAVEDSPAARRRAVGVVVASIRSQAAAALSD